MSSNRELLRINTGAADTQLFTTGFNKSFFARRPWGIMSDTIRTRFRKTITQNLAFGQTATFQYPKTGVLLDDIYLDVTISAITGVGAGTFARLCDYAGLGICSEMKLSSSLYPLQRKLPQHLFMNLIRDHNIEKRDVQEAFVAGNLTDAERNTRATAAQTLRVPLKFFWYRLPCHTPVTVALSQFLQVDITFANLSDIVQTDFAGGATATIQSIKWVYDMIQTTGKDRDEASNPVLRTARGKTFLIEQTNSAALGYQKIAAGSTEAVINLTGLTAPWSTIYVMLQNYADVTTAFAKKPFDLPLSLFNNVATYAWRDGETVIQDFDDVFDTLDRWEKYHVVGQWRKPLLVACVTEVADIKNQNLGSLNSSNIGNFNFHITFKTPLAADATLHFTFFEHNWVNQQGGEMIRVFNA